MSAASGRRRRSEAVRLICEHHRDPDVSAAVLADIVGVSRRQLDRVFAGSASVSSILLEMRLLAAAEQLIAAPRQPMWDVAVAAGFRDVNTFRVHFITAFGETPSVFRARHGL